jgi:hypothetical protein
LIKFNTIRASIETHYIGKNCLLVLKQIMINVNHSELDLGKKPCIS